MCPGDPTCNLGMCPDRELNPQSLDVWDDAPTNLATQPGQNVLCFYLMIVVEVYRSKNFPSFSFKICALMYVKPQFEIKKKKPTHIYYTIGSSS